MFTKISEQAVILLRGCGSVLGGKPRLLLKPQLTLIYSHSLTFTHRRPELTYIYLPTHSPIHSLTHSSLTGTRVTRTGTRFLQIGLKDARWSYFSIL